MDKQKAKIGNTDFFTGKCDPMLFCTPLQTGALIAENRRLFFLIRHGTTDWNMETRLQGREEIPLNRRGIAQAQSCAEGLKRVFGKELRPKKIYSSPLSRAYDTGSIISAELGIPSPTVLQSLIERDYGSVTGMTFAARRELFKSGGYPDDMESPLDTTVRMKRAIAQIRKNEKASPNEVLVLVTHGGILNSFFSHITCRRAGSGGCIVANCTVGIVAAGARDVIPIAFNLGSNELYDFIGKLPILK